MATNDQDPTRNYAAAIRDLEAAISDYERAVKRTYHVKNIWDFYIDPDKYEDVPPEVDDPLETARRRKRQAMDRVQLELKSLTDKMRGSELPLDGDDRYLR